MAIGIALTTALVSMLFVSGGATPALAAATVTETAWTPLACLIAGGISSHIAVGITATRPISVNPGQAFGLTGVTAVQVLPPAAQTAAGATAGAVNAFQGVVSDFENNLTNATANFAPGSSTPTQLNQVMAVQNPNLDGSPWTDPLANGPSPLEGFVDSATTPPSGNFSFGAKPAGLEGIPIVSDGSATQNAYGPAPGRGGGSAINSGTPTPLSINPIKVAGNAGENVVIDAGNASAAPVSVSGLAEVFTAGATIFFFKPSLTSPGEPDGTWIGPLPVSCGIDTHGTLSTPAPAPGYCTNTPGTLPNVPSGCFVHKFTIPITAAGTMQSVTQSSVSTAQYTLSNSNGSTWQEIDPARLRVTSSPAANQSTVLTANADLFTANAGFNQDIGIFVQDGVGADVLLAWKESGGFAGIFSPNAAYVQTRFDMTGGHNYVFKLKWKTNNNAAGATIFAGAGSGPYSPTSLAAETFANGVVPNFAVSTQQYTFANSNGTSWQDIDPANLQTTVVAAANSTAVLGANVDLFTANAGYNQDIGIWVQDNAVPDALVAWKESGGFAGTFSPNAAFVKATYAMTSGHTYIFKLKWKTNKNASGATILAAAGGGAPFSNTSLLAETVASGANPYSSVSTSQYSLANSNGTVWAPIDTNLDVTVTPATDTNSIVGANADLFTSSPGYNQDIGIFVKEGSVEQLLAWKESGGFAGTFSPNAAFSQVHYDMTAGHTYVFKLKWKTNKNATGTGATIFAAAGTGPTFSNTKLVVALRN